MESNFSIPISGRVFARVFEIPVSGRTASRSVPSIPVSGRSTQSQRNDGPFSVVVLPDTDTPRVEHFDSLELLLLFLGPMKQQRHDFHVLDGIYCPVLQQPGSDRLFLQDRYGVKHEIGASLEENALRPRHLLVTELI